MSAANAVLPGLLRYLRRHQPGVDVHLEHAPADGQVLSLRQRRIDIGLFGLPADVATGRLVVEPLLRDPHVLAVPYDHPLARSVELGPVPLQAVREEPFVFWPRPMAPSLYDEIMLHFIATGTHPRIVASTVTQPGHARAGFRRVGISLVPRRTATALHRSGVVYRAVVDPAVVILAAAHRPDPGPAVQAVLAACRATSPDGSDTAEPLGPGST